MEKTNDGYVLQADGSMGYDCNYHTDRFTFLDNERATGQQSQEISEDGKSLRAMFTKYMKELSGVSDDGLDHQDLIKVYLKEGIGDIPHCVHQYIWNRYYYPHILDGRECEKMYLEGVDFLNDLADKGKLERDNIRAGG
ncbi:MAG: hypothetical protein AAF575_00170 [Bacteroidota bacterium]